MSAKRFFDLICVVPGLLVLAPVFLFAALWIKWDSPGPVFFRQVRVGKAGKHFRIFKLRTMLADAEQNGIQITVSGDRRITRSGRFLRKYKLDEFPQLINVLTGDMSLVGPRPEVPRYVAHYPETIKSIVLSVRPGITDVAAIEFINENEILAKVDDPEAHYIAEILPAKLNCYKNYVLGRTLGKDMLLILHTLLALFRSAKQA